MKHFARGVGQSNPEQWFNNNRVNIPGKKEVIWQPLYDTQAYPAAGAASILFFQDQIGKGTPVKTLADTNMELDGQLPKGQAFLATGIQLQFKFLDSVIDDDGSAVGGTLEFVDDVRAFAENGSLTMRIQSKEYVRQAPLGKFPPVERLGYEFAGGGASATNITVSYAQLSGREFALRELLLESNQNFSIELKDLPALPSGLDAEIVCSINGYLARNAQ